MSDSDATTLYGNGTPGGIGGPNNPTPAAKHTLAFQEDCAHGVLAALAGNEDLWNTTALVIQYDETTGSSTVVPPTPNKAQSPRSLRPRHPRQALPAATSPSVSGSGSHA